MNRLTAAALTLSLSALAACNQGARDGGASVKADTNPWFAAAASNDAATLNAAAASGADVNAHETRDYSTPLHLAANAGHEPAIRALLERGALVDALDEDGRRPLMLACHRSKTAAALTLINRGGANVALRDRQEQTALMFAARNGNTEVVRVMTARSAPLDAQRSDGWTALHLAAREGQIDAVRALTEAGASTTLPDRRGRTPADVAGSQTDHSRLGKLTKSHPNRGGGEGVPDESITVWEGEAPVGNRLAKRARRIELPTFSLGS